MRIKLESMFGVFGLDLASTFGGDEVELADEPITLKTLLDILTEQSAGKVSFDDEQNDSDTDHYVVLLNSNEISSLKNGLNTHLKNGDEVSIAPVDLLFSGG